MEVIKQTQSQLNNFKPIPKVKCSKKVKKSSLPNQNRRKKKILHKHHFIQFTFSLFSIQPPKGTHQLSDIAPPSVSSMQSQKLVQTPSNTELTCSHSLRYEEQGRNDLDCDLIPNSAVQPYLANILDYILEKEKNQVVGSIVKEQEITYMDRFNLCEDLLKWGEFLGYELQTIYLAVNIVDRVSKNVRRENMDLLAVSSLFMASKYNEVMVHPIESLVSVWGKCLTLSDILGMQSKIWRMINFDLSYVSPLRVIDMWGIGLKVSKQVVKKAYEVARQILGFGFIRQYRSSIISLCCIQACIQASLNVQELPTQYKKEFQSCFSQVLHTYFLLGKQLPVFKYFS